MFARTALLAVLVALLAACGPLKRDRPPYCVDADKNYDCNEPDKPIKDEE